MKPHILFITSTNLASNPRCHKEIGLALNLRYRITYIAFDLPGWTREKERQIQNELPEAEKTYLPAGRGNFVSWGIITFLEIFLRKIYKRIPVLSLIAFAVSKRSIQLTRALKKLKEKPDLVIAHNPAAFYPAYYFSKKNKIPFAIDVEDYHPGEGNNKALARLNIQLIKRILPFAEYVSFAAPLIKEKIINDILSKKIKKALIINNVFQEKEFVPPARTSATGKIKLVWFSQNIDKGRGLEEILPVIENLKDFFEFTIIGNLREEYSKFLKPFQSFVNTISPLSQRELHLLLGCFDIGLAIEPGKDLNNSLAVSNKIWAYFQAGLFIIASDTVAQQNFIKQFNKHGIIIDLFDKENLRHELINLYEKWNELKTKKTERFETAKAYNWEIESEQLKIKWKEIVQT